MRGPRLTYRLADPEFGPRELELLAKCVEEGMVSSQGRFVRQFEDEFAAAFGTSHAVSVCNGTCALHLALMALEAGPGDEIIVPSLTFIATANSVVYTGATPIFADVDPHTLCISAETIRPLITAKTKGIIPVHLLGQPCDMAQISRLAREHGLFVIEDAAEAHGAQIGNKSVGSFGDVGCFSFYGNKIITTGEGGMCITSDSALATKMTLLRDQGMDLARRYWYPVIGYNYRMTNLQAAIGLAQLPHLEKWVERRQWVAGQYKKGLAPFLGADSLLPKHFVGSRASCWMTVMILGEEDDREKLMKFLEGKGVETRPLFWPIHEMPPYRARGLTRLPTTEQIARRGVFLPSHTKLQEDDLTTICGYIESWIGQTPKSNRHYANR